LSAGFEDFAPAVIDFAEYAGNHAPHFIAKRPFLWSLGQQPAGLSLCPQSGVPPGRKSVARWRCSRQRLVVTAVPTGPAARHLGVGVISHLIMLSVPVIWSLTSLSTLTADAAAAAFSPLGRAKLSAAGLGGGKACNGALADHATLLASFIANPYTQPRSARYRRRRPTRNGQASFRLDPSSSRARRVMASSEVRHGDSCMPPM
jgi:hypothetical protein